MFYLNKTDDIWTLHYEVSPLRRMLLIGAGLGGLGIGVFESLQENPSSSTIALVIPGILCLALMGYWVLSDAPTTAAFDLKQRRLDIDCQRPWFGRPRACPFTDVVALYAVSRSGETVDSWEAIIELSGGRRIALGREAEGRDERIRRYLEEIRAATGIAGN